MHKLNIHKTGLAVGTFVGFAHLGWVMLVGMGKAAGGLSFILGLHFLSNPYQMLAFSWKGGLVLIVVTTIVGYIAGSVFAFIWNKTAAN